MLTLRLSGSGFVSCCQNEFKVPSRKTAEIWVSNVWGGIKQRFNLPEQPDQTLLRLQSLSLATVVGGSKFLQRGNPPEAEKPPWYEGTCPHG